MATKPDPNVRIDNFLPGNRDSRGAALRRPALTGVRPVTAAQTHEFRFRSELKPGHGSWISVLVTYALGAAILFALVQFLSGFERYSDAVQEADARVRGNAAVAQLLRDLDAADSRDEEDRALALFEASPANRDAAGAAQGVADLLTRHRNGASKPATLRRYAS